MKEVYPGIFLIEEKGRFSPSDNIYVLTGNNDGLIYDAGYGSKKALKYFFEEFKEILKFCEEQNKKFKITRIIASHGHSDHFSGLSSVSEILGLKIILTEKIAKTIKDKVSFEANFRSDDYEDFLRVRTPLRKIWNLLRRLGMRLFFRGVHGLSYLDHPDEIIDENSVIIINGEQWKIFPSPGHSPEHISLYSEEKGILFSGDNVLKMRSTWLGPPESNITDYIETIKKIQNLPNLKLILPAHGEIIDNPKETLSAILERMNERERQVLDAINNHSKKGLSPDQILNLIYSKSKKFTRIIGRDWVVLTLKMLEKKELIKRTVVKKKMLFFLA